MEGSQDFASQRICWTLWKLLNSFQDFAGIDEDSDDSLDRCLCDGDNDDIIWNAIETNSNQIS
jgi:hypothetical protein